MAGRIKRVVDRHLPIGLPESVSLPTLKESEEAVRKAERMIVEKQNDLKGKVTGPTPEMLRTIITI